MASADPFPQVRHVPSWFGKGHPILVEGGDCINQDNESDTETQDSDGLNQMEAGFSRRVQHKHFEGGKAVPWSCHHSSCGLVSWS